jgi:hypothetical protein
MAKLFFGILFYGSVLIPALLAIVYFSWFEFSELGRVAENVFTIGIVPAGICQYFICKNAWNLFLKDWNKYYEKMPGLPITLCTVFLTLALNFGITLSLLVYNGAASDPTQEEPYGRITYAQHNTLSDSPGFYLVPKIRTNGIPKNQ